jgi:hypothetical protein
MRDADKMAGVEPAVRSCQLSSAVPHCQVSTAVHDSGPFRPTLVHCWSPGAVEDYLHGQEGLFNKFNLEKNKEYQSQCCGSDSFLPDSNLNLNKNTESGPEHLCSMTD